jgi:uncharacterized protein (TIGR02594 family)
VNGTDDPPWLAWALRELRRGVREIPGSVHNPRILYYHTFCRLHAKADEVAWCAAFVCAALENGGMRSTRSAAAVSFANFGRPSELVDGAIIGWGKHDPDAVGTGHVALYYKGKALGGNQANRVGLDVRDMGKIAFCRWPLVS